MRRQRAKHAPVPVVSSYRGRGFRQAALWLAAAPALPGLALILIRPLGMRFSGFLLVALAAVLLAVDLSGYCDERVMASLGERIAVVLDRMTEMQDGEEGGNPVS